MNHELPIPPAVTLYWQEQRIKQLEAALEEVLPRYIELFAAQFADDPETSIGVKIMREALGKGSPPEPVV